MTISVRPSSRKAFTLIELLVVISIVGILVAIALPVFTNVQRKGRQIQSMSNLKQWGAAMLSSAGDHNNQLPWEGQPVSPTGLSTTDAKGITAWYNLLPPYMGLKALNAMRTSEYPRAGQKSVWVNPAVPLASNAKYTPFLFCYGMNYYLSTSASPNLTITQMDHPSATVFLAETGDDFANCNPSDIQAFFGGGNVLTDPDNAANFLFCDGHVALFKRREFDPKFNPKVLQGSATQHPELAPDTTLTFVPNQGAAQQ